MINIKKNSITPVVLELTLSSTLTSPYYLFEFINGINSNNITYFNSEDLSPYKSRFNRFDITETGSTSTDLSVGIINLIPGSYTYNVYESATPTLHTSGTTGQIIDTGKVLVSGDDLTLNDVYK